jgi:diphthine synthase
MLNIIGIGLRGLESITIESADVIRSSDEVYLDTYTSILPDGSQDEISRFFNREIIAVGREFIEGESPIIERSRNRTVSLLVAGDGMSATTHKVLEKTCISMGISVNVLENASILNVIPGRLGLYTYKMGPPVSLPFITDKFFPVSVFNKIRRNHSNGMHTIVLLDLKSGRNIGISQAIGWLLEMESTAEGEKFLDNEHVCVVSRVSQAGEKIMCGNIRSLESIDFQSPAAIVILSNPDTFEMENIESFRIAGEDGHQAWNKTGANR